ncbi:hypothetical protein BG015_011875 [Linnemannia schmuckeri]|uniref:Uncharacterized protein n=1 Tax=Linnemannia schmuckeri TaxID=64567 RepID=A0A9P5RUS1_9FUNG|nr:hypothetical protein BG015_011875 [Linnemannia schmuckeri]
MVPAIYSLRFWMVLVTLANLSIVITYHAWSVPEMDKIMAKRIREINEDFNQNLPATQYHWGKKSLVSNKHARAVLMLLPALFLIGVQLCYIDLEIRYAKWFNADLTEESPRYNPFSCAGINGGVSALCAVLQSYTFIPIIVGFFVIIEVTVTLVPGPLHPAKAAYF